MGFGGPPPPPGVGGNYAGVGPQLAEWWQRLVAIIIDGILLSCVSAPFGTFRRATNTDGTTANFSLTGGKVFAPLVIGILYYGLMNGLLGKTLGKMALGIKVVSKGTDNLIGPGKGILRAVVSQLLWLVVCIGGLVDNLMPLWDKDRQSIHDKVAGSQVVKAR
jgi:uncharacterized RDD family membrane protein YckC